MLSNTFYEAFLLEICPKAVPLQCVFHSIRFKVNKGWSTAVLLFLCPYVNFCQSLPKNFPNTIQKKREANASRSLFYRRSPRTSSSCFHCLSIQKTVSPSLKNTDFHLPHTAPRTYSRRRTRHTRIPESSHRESAYGLNDSTSDRAECDDVHK